MGTRNKIVDAAMDIVREQGAARLTLDEAAAKAGVSKGGVLYHFKTKDDLIRAMVKRLVDQCDELSRRYYEAEPEGPYRWARAVVRSAFDPQGPTSEISIGGALVAAVAANAELVAPLQAKFEEWVARIKSDSPDPLRAAIVCMAMDGHYFERMMGLDLYSPDELERIQQTALELLT